MFTLIDIIMFILYKWLFAGSARGFFYCRTWKFINMRAYIRIKFAVAEHNVVQLVPSVQVITFFITIDHNDSTQTSVQDPWQFVRLRILGFVHLRASEYGSETESGSCSFVILRCQHKISFFIIFFAYYFLWVHLHQSSTIKSH
jgi:hypothetical protein